MIHVKVQDNIPQDDFLKKKYGNVPYALLCNFIRSTSDFIGSMSDYDSKFNGFYNYLFSVLINLF